MCTQRLTLPTGTVNTKMLFAGWGPIGMRVQVGSGQQRAPAARARPSPHGTRSPPGSGISIVDCGCIHSLRTWPARAACTHGHLAPLLLQDANDEFYAATDPTLDSVSGTYFVGSRQTRSPAISYDKEVQQQLWGVLVEQTGARWDV